MGNRGSTARRPSLQESSFKGRLSGAYGRSSSRSSIYSGQLSPTGSRSPTIERKSPDWITGRSRTQTTISRLSNDEIDRQQQQHYLFLLQLGANHFAPIESPSSALDIGCGTGIWMMEMATAFPDCEFTGLDQSNAQPDDVLPPNCAFLSCEQLVGNIPFGDVCFDYVHQRMMASSIPTEEWGPVCNELFRLTRPSGWTEIVDTDGLIHGHFSSGLNDVDLNGLGLCVDVSTELAELTNPVPSLGPAAERINGWLQAAMLRRRVVQPEKVFELRTDLAKSGFTHIYSRQVSIPMGSWGQEAGRACLATLRGEILCLRDFLLDEAMVDVQLFDDTLYEWEREVEHGQYHMEVAIYWAQRPV